MGRKVVSKLAASLQRKWPAFVLYGQTLHAWVVCARQGVELKQYSCHLISDEIGNNHCIMGSIGIYTQGIQRCKSKPW